MIYRLFQFYVCYAFIIIFGFVLTIKFHYTTAFSFNHAFTVQINLSTIHAALGSGFIDAYNFVHKNGFCSVNVTRFSKTYFISNNEIKEFSG